MYCRFKPFLLLRDSDIAFFICGLPLDEKGLSDVREVQVAVEFGCGPDFADFDPAVIRWVAMDKIGVLAVFKI